MTKEWQKFPDQRKPFVIKDSKGYLTVRIK